MRETSYHSFNQTHCGGQPTAMGRLAQTLAFFFSLTVRTMSPQSSKYLPLCSVAAIVLVATLLTACDSPKIKQAKKLIESDLVDPTSAEYREVKTYVDGTVCGETNAKNRMGGYSGFERFAVHEGKRVLNRTFQAALCTDYPDKEELLRKVYPAFKSEREHAECVKTIKQSASAAKSMSDINSLEQRIARECTATNLYQ